MQYFGCYSSLVSDYKPHAAMSDSSPLQRNTPAEISQLLAQRLRGLRLLLGWKQQTLAQRSGVSVATIRRIEQTGHSSVENLLKLCHALGRLDDFEQLLQPPPAQSLDPLEARQSLGEHSGRQRGNR